jgi:hypothetical protein
MKGTIVEVRERDIVAQVDSEEGLSRESFLEVYRKEDGKEVIVGSGPVKMINRMKCVRIAFSEGSPLASSVVGDLVRFASGS